MTTCARKGCRNKAIYLVVLTKDERALQGWDLCPADRDEVQAAIAAVVEKSVKITELAGMAKALARPRQIRGLVTTEVDRHDERNNREIAGESQGTQDTSEVTARGRRPVARPVNNA